MNGIRESKILTHEKIQEDDKNLDCANYKTIPIRTLNLLTNRSVDKKLDLYQHLI